MRCALSIVVLVIASWWSAGAQAPGASPPLARDVAELRKGNVERGRYLVEQVAMCVECHSERDDSGTIIPGRKYLGGQIPTGPAWARDWATRAPRNAGLPGYDDAAAVRLLMQGAVARDGRQLQPPMPRFRMTAEDAADVIAFMRSLQ
jgi:mono/diheme cytochrome c family protein